MPATKSATRPKSKSSSTSTSSRSADYGIFGELKKDHKEILGYFKQLKKGRDAGTFTRLSQELSQHQTAEELAFYAPLEHDEKVREEILEGYEEHHAGTMMLSELESEMWDDEHFKAKVSVLMEMVQHHIDEEEHTLFSLAKKLVDKERAEQMLEDFEHHKR